MRAAPHYAAPTCNGRYFGPRPMPEEARSWSRYGLPDRDHAVANVRQ